MSVSLDRRALLATAGAIGGLGTLAGCTSSGDSVPPSASPAPSAVDAVAADEATLIGMYDAAIAAYPDLASGLAPIRQHHVEHAAALMGDPSASPAPVAGSAAPTADGALAVLIAAERDASRARIAACLAEGDLGTARTLSFIAASEASHVPYLRDLRA